MQAVKSFVDVGLIRVALTLASDIPSGNPIFSIHSVHAANVCNHVLASLFANSTFPPEPGLAETRKLAAKQFAETLACILNCGGMQSAAIQSIIVFICANTFSEMRNLLEDRYLSNALAKATVRLVVDMIKKKNSGREQPLCIHLIPSFSWVARAVLLWMKGLCLTPGYSHIVSFDIPAPIFNIPWFPSLNINTNQTTGRDSRSFRRAFATRDAATSFARFLTKRTVPHQPFRKEVGETLLVSTFPNILAHTRRYRWTETRSEGAGISNISAFCPGTTSARPGGLPSSTIEVPRATGSLGALFRSLTQLFQLLPEAKEINSASYKKHTSQFCIPVGHLRAASTLSAFLCPPTMCDPSQAVQSLSFQPSKLPVPRVKVTPFLVNAHLLRLRGHAALLWSMAVSCGYVSIQMIDDMHCVLVLLGSFMKDAPGLNYCDFAVVGEVLAYSRFLLASETQEVLSCSFKTLARVNTSEAWMQCTVELCRHACKTMSKPSLAGAVTKLIFGNPRAVSIIYEYTDLILIHSDAILPRQNSLRPRHDTLQPDLDHCYLPVFLLLNFTVQLGCVLLDYPNNHKQNMSHMIWHDPELEYHKLFAIFSRLKCFVEPRSGLYASFWRNNVHRQQTDCFRAMHFVETATAALAFVYQAMLIPSGPFFGDVDSQSAQLYAVFRTFLQGFNSMSKNVGPHLSEWKHICEMQLKIITVICGSGGNLSSLGAKCRDKPLHHSLEPRACISDSARDALAFICGCTEADCSHAKDVTCLHDLTAVIFDYFANEICLEHETYGPDKNAWPSNKIDMLTQSTASYATEEVPVSWKTERSCIGTSDHLWDPNDTDLGHANMHGTCSKLSRKNIRRAHADHIYVMKRKARRVYLHPDTQRAIVEVVLRLLAHADHYLEHRSPERIIQHRTKAKCNAQKQMGFIFLRLHLKRSENREVLSNLLSSIHLLDNDEVRALRLSCESLFQSCIYRPQELIARGMHANVHRCTVPIELKLRCRDEAVVKLIEAPETMNYICTTTKVFTEIALLEAMENDPLIAKLLDYGVSEGSYSIIMQRYPSSLKHWRASQHYDLDEHGSITPAILHFNIYTLCIETVCALAEYGVTHFDIKADNFLLEPGPCCSVTDFWDPPDNSQCPPFRVVITDFSESRISSVSQTMGTLHTNGTEYIKAPEILILSAMNKIREYHRGSNQCGQQADVWSLGCLLFEIIANDYM